MINQMRIHQKKIERLLEEYPAGSGKWQRWLEYHEYSVRYFQANRNVYVWITLALMVSALVILALALNGGAWGLWVLEWLVFLAFLAVGYYGCVYTGILHQLEEQTERLFEKTMAIETKPGTTAARYWADVAGHLVSNWAQKWRDWKVEND